eukprot:268719-Rhodomonas_salina.1
MPTSATARGRKEEGAEGRKGRRERARESACRLGAGVAERGLGRAFWPRPCRGPNRRSAIQEERVVPAPRSSCPHRMPVAPHARVSTGHRVGHA